MQGSESIENNISMMDLVVRDTVAGSVKRVVRMVPIMVLIFTFILLLFFGVGWMPKDNYKNINVAIADLDGGLIGKALLKVSQSPSILFTGTILNSTSVDSVASEVNSGNFNAALVANPGATASLMAALVNPKAAYLPAAAMSFIFDEGRSTAMLSVLRLTWRKFH